MVDCTEEILGDVSPEEMALAMEVAFLQVQQLVGIRGPLAAQDEVIYRAPGGLIHTGPLVVLSTDAMTALIAGFMNGNPRSIQLRVMRSEVVRVADAEGIVHRILSEAHPCPHCHPGKAVPKGN